MSQWNTFLGSREVTRQWEINVRDSSVCTMLAKKSHLKVRVLHIKLNLQSPLWSYTCLNMCFSLWERVGKQRFSKSSKAMRILKSFFSSHWLRKKCLLFWKTLTFSLYLFKWESLMNCSAFNKIIYADTPINLSI